MKDGDKNPNKRLAEWGRRLWLLGVAVQLALHRLCLGLCGLYHPPFEFVFRGGQSRAKLQQKPSTKTIRALRVTSCKLTTRRSNMSCARGLASLLVSGAWLTALRPAVLTVRRDFYVTKISAEAPGLAQQNGKHRHMPAKKKNIK